MAFAKVRSLPIPSRVQTHLDIVGIQLQGLGRVGDGKAISFELDIGLRAVSRGDHASQQASSYVQPDTSGSDIITLTCARLQ